MSNFGCVFNIYTNNCKTVYFFKNRPTSYKVTKKILLWSKKKGRLVYTPAKIDIRWNDTIQNYERVDGYNESAIIVPKSRFVKFKIFISINTSYYNKSFPIQPVQQ